MDFNRKEWYNLLEKVKDLGYEFNFGRHKGKMLSEVITDDFPYIAWLALNTKYYDDLHKFNWKIPNDILQQITDWVYHFDYTINLGNGSVYKESKRYVYSPQVSTEKERFDVDDYQDENLDIFIMDYYFG